MNPDRRRAITLAAAAAVWAGRPNATSARQAARRGSVVKAVAFDAFPIFDPRPAFATLDKAVPGHGDRLRQVFFDKVFGYTWLRTAGGRYKDFSLIMDDALQFAAASLTLDLSANARERIVETFFHLPVWPDVKPALEHLRGQGVRVAFLSNMSEAMLRANMQANAIESLFDHVLSTDRARVFKPHPAAYQLGPETLSLPREQIAFAAFAGWDAAGASWFGYPTVWVNRLGAPPEVLDAAVAATGRGLDVLVDLVGA